MSTPKPVVSTIASAWSSFTLPHFRKPTLYSQLVRPQVQSHIWSSLSPATHVQSIRRFFVPFQRLALFAISMSPCVLVFLHSVFLMSEYWLKSPSKLGFPPFLKFRIFALTSVLSSENIPYCLVRLVIHFNQLFLYFILHLKEGFWMIWVMVLSNTELFKLSISHAVQSSPAEWLVQGLPVNC